MESALTISPPVSRASRSASADLPLAVGPAISQMRRVMLSLTLVSPDRAAAREAYHTAQSLLNAEGRRLGPHAYDIDWDVEEARGMAYMQTILREMPVDFCVQSSEGRRKRLLVADMDSTIINVECLDELADFAGLKAEISAITERAMRGELAFEGALRERVGMLKGLAVTALQQAYDERVRLNPGARTLVRTMAANGARCSLVSGGFSFFTGRVAQAAGFHSDRANTLLIADEKLTGHVGEPILGKEAKLEALEEDAAVIGVPLAAALAVGDGANDLAMIEAAGLGIAYRAKPVVAARADAKVDHADLTALLYFQGYTQDEFVTD
jgi:phosphoserine phosphatase